MKNETLEYFDGQQRLVSELFFDENSSAPQPAVLVFPAFEGRSAFALNYAKSLAECGFATLAVDMYGDAQVATTIDDCLKLIGPFLKDRELVRRRAVLAFQALCKQSQINKNKISAIGFCFGGMCVLELARSGENLKAGVSLHGVLAKSHLPTKPLTTKLLILHGYQDPQVPPSALVQFAEEMAAINVDDWTFTFFGDAKHSYTDPKTGSFDPQKEKEMGREYNAKVAARAFRYMKDFLAEILE